MFPQPIRAGVKPAPAIGRPTRWVGAGFIPARTERAVALTAPLESLNLGSYHSLLVGKMDLDKKVASHGEGCTRAQEHSYIADALDQRLLEILS